ncbi:hypothetical protein [Pseudoalteromonas luteoviolacea]|uniref:Uncharacterized protein n=1 Tax=Pseudoalteromonas luteoviolacea NCIMB 1942 TaxID=1365253 RepID=A0A166ZJM0_9GAMM|nr:hypothetical protein [Pseudoalteromonas luteoviolacea]KZN44381.1 hypothetical protein N482_16570 [Pseudoalteromonas luteoviolacea NCIMB 1942]
MLVDVFGLVVGTFNGYTDKLINDFYLTLNGVFIAYAVYLSDIPSYKIEEFLRRFSYCFTFTFSFAVSIMVVQTILNIPHYPAVASNLALIPIFYFLSKKRYALVAFLILMVFLSGKRSVFIIFAFLMPFFILFNRGVKLGTVASIGAVLSASMLLILLPVATYLEDNADKFSAGRSVINKFALLNPLSDNFDLKSAAGERFEEVYNSIEAHHQNPYSFLIGSGNGFAYKLEVHRKDMIEENRHGVHFAPVDFYTKYGFLFVLSMTIFIILYLMKVFPYLKCGVWYFNVLVFYQVFVLFYSFLGSNFGLDSMFWMSIGFALLLIDEIKEAQEREEQSMYAHKT